MSKEEDTESIPCLIPTEGSEDVRHLLRIGKLFSQKLYNRTTDADDQQSPHEWTAEIKFSRALTEKELQNAFSPILLQNIERLDTGFPGTVSFYGVHRDEMYPLFQNLSLEDLRPNPTTTTTNDNSNNKKHKTSHQNQQNNNAKKNKNPKFERAVVITRVVQQGGETADDCSCCGSDGEDEEEEEHDADHSHHGKEDEEHDHHHHGPEDHVSIHLYRR